MERVAVFVDAGYFWVQVSHIVCGDRRDRSEIQLNAHLLRESLLKQVKMQFPNSSLLRIYWYDGYGENDTPTDQHKAISWLDDIKMRFGTRNKKGEQKGVDGLLMSDLIVLAQNKAISSAIIISGDADLIPGITVAQQFGVRIHCIGMNGTLSLSPRLREEVDKTTEWNRSDIEMFAKPQSAKNSSTLDNIVNEFITSLKNEEKDELLNNPLSIPQYLDSRLLKIARSHLNRYLQPEETKELRKLIHEQIK